MGLNFPDEWRFNEGLGRMPQAAFGELIGLVEKVAAQAPSSKAVYEIFKARFGSSSMSSTESWAHSDMVDAMSGGDRNVPEFLEAYWSAMEDVSDDVATPSAERINGVLRKHGVGYALYPPRLVQEINPVIATADEPVAPVANLAGYIIGERLGGGAFGEVFTATRRTPFCEFEFAVKFHRPSVFADPDRARVRFEREAVALGKLQHRGIVAYTDAGIDARGQPFLVMSLVKGVDLRDATAGQGVRTVAWFMLEVLGAVAFAHANGVLHRDLKPANIIVRQTDLQPVIVDFGLAYLVDEAIERGLTVSGIGTGPYVPHESQVNPRERSPAHDVYSCGVILYETVARQVPDPSRYKPLATVDQRWAPLDPLVQRAIAPAGERFSSATEFREALEAVYESLS